MKYALAALGFINSDINYNKKVIIDTIKNTSTKADMILFGESFLQGFYALDFKTDSDFDLALSIDDPIIREIKQVAFDYKTGVSFGFIERDKDNIYSSQMTIDKNGDIINIFRRVSAGWKESFAGERYCEGDGFHSFNLDGNNIVVGLCGDLWIEGNNARINQLDPDLVFWPVYTDYNYKDWNENIKYDYADQAQKISAPVLYINSYCIDKQDEYEIAKGGAALFVGGNIKAELPSGKEGILFVNLK